MNPAVTIGVTLAGILNPLTALFYVFMQILGAVTGAGIASVSMRICYDIIVLMYTLYSFIVKEQ